MKNQGILSIVVLAGSFVASCDKIDSVSQESLDVDRITTVELVAERSICAGELMLDENIPFGVVVPNPIVNLFARISGEVGFGFHTSRTGPRGSSTVYLSLRGSLHLPDITDPVYSFAGESEDLVLLSPTQPTEILKEYVTRQGDDVVTLSILYEITPCGVVTESMWASKRNIPLPHDQAE